MGVQTYLIVSSFVIFLCYHLQPLTMCKTISTSVPFLSQCHDFSDFLWSCLFQTAHAVSQFLIRLFSLTLFCCCSRFYFQFYLFLIFLTLSQLSKTLPHYYSQHENLYFLILLHNILPH